MNDVNIPACRFSADIVAYMYGELPASDSFAFESHLLECEACTDEFAAVSNSRYEIYEWKKLAFDPLETPAIAIPYGEVASVSWIERLRVAFTNAWLAPGVAFAGLAIVAAATGVFLLSGDAERGSVDLADNRSIPIVEEPSSAPPAATTQGNTEADVVPRSDPENIRVASPPRTEPNRVIRSQKRVVPRPVENPAVTASQSRPAPRLNEFAEDEDTSLRLAELFEDIETSD